MYEKHGLMSKITNPEALEFLRSKPMESHTQIVETALCLKLGIPTEANPPKTGHSKKADCRNAVPIKITNQGLIDHVISQKRNFGICYRHTIESALLGMKRAGK